MTPNADRVIFRTRLPDAYFGSSVCRQHPSLPSRKTCIYTTNTLPSSTSLHFGSPASKVSSMAGRILERNWFDGVIPCMITSDQWGSLLPSHDFQLGSDLVDTLIRVNREPRWIIIAIALSFDCQCASRSRSTNPMYFRAAATTIRWRALL